MKKINKIVLDADVIIHFHKGDMLSILPTILSKYNYIILDKVYAEIRNPLKKQLDNQIQYFKNISVVSFEPSGEILREYTILRKTKGKGESACMAYCKFNNDVIGSSNLKDIDSYCNEHNITYLTTIDFLYFAYNKGLLTKNDIDTFIVNVRNKGSILPNNIDIATYICNKPNIDSD